VFSKYSNINKVIPQKNMMKKREIQSLNANSQIVQDNVDAKNLLEGFLEFSGRYKILGYNGSQFSKLGTTFTASLNIKF
jgi:iron complex outermembrane receptor protein